MFTCISIIVGVSIVELNRIIQFRILEKKLLPNGQVSNDNGMWKTASPFSLDTTDASAGIDYHTLTWQNRSIALDTVVDLNRVVTGVRFRIIDSLIRLEVRFTDFEYQTGLLQHTRHSQWAGNSRLSVQKLEPIRPDNPTKTMKKSMPIVGENFAIDFQPSDVEKDAAQSTIPFIDASPLQSNIPLSGVGLHLKSQVGYGGFVAPKLVVFDSGLYITPINQF